MSAKMNLVRASYAHTWPRIDRILVRALQKSRILIHNIDDYKKKVKR